MATQRHCELRVRYGTPFYGLLLPAERRSLKFVEHEVEHQDQTKDFIKF
jgi:hypothetical protein